MQTEWRFDHYAFTSIDSIYPIVFFLGASHNVRYNTSCAARATKLLWPRGVSRKKLLIKLLGPHFGRPCRARRAQGLGPWHDTFFEDVKTHNFLEMNTESKSEAAYLVSRPSHTNTRQNTTKNVTRCAYEGAKTTAFYDYRGSGRKRGKMK